LFQATGSFNSDSGLKHARMTLLGFPGSVNRCPGRMESRIELLGAFPFQGLESGLKSRGAEEDNWTNIQKYLENCHSISTKRLSPKGGFKTSYSIVSHKFLTLDQPLPVTQSGVNQSHIYRKLNEIATASRFRPLLVNSRVTPRNDETGLSFCKELPGRDAG